MYKLIIAFITLCFITTISQAQDLGIKAPPQDHTVLITHATIHTMAGKTITDGSIVFDNTGITSILDSGMVPTFAPGTKLLEIDATGKHIYPGLISPYSQLGLTEIGAVRATHDHSEVGSFLPEVKAATAINPDSTILPVTRSNGILVAAVFPDASLNLFGDGDPTGLIPGRASVIRMDGWTTEDMTIAADAGVIVNEPLPRPIKAWWMSQKEDAQKKKINRALDMLETFYTNAIAYNAARPTAHNAHPKNTTLPTDLRYEAMADSLAGAGDAQTPTFFMANDLDQITGALAFASRHHLRPVIVGGRDAGLCTNQLKEANASVILQSSYRMPKRDDSPYDELYTLPQKLGTAGIPYAIASAEETPHERSLPYAGALAVAHGLPADDALAALTITPATILGISDRYGSLKVGKSATIIITDGNPLDVRTHVELAFIDSRAIDLANKQTKLAQKYREKYIQLGLLPKEK